MTWVGCSNTCRHAWGHCTQWPNSPQRLFVPGANPTTAPYGTGGGALLRWAVPPGHPSDRGHRAIFEGVWQSGYPVWVQWCIRNGETPTMAAAEDQIDAWWAWFYPLVTNSGADPLPYVWVSPLNLFEEDPDQVHDAEFHAEANEYTLALHPGLMAGPVTGPLTPSMLASDGTHPNAAGRAFLGTQIYGAFNHYISDEAPGLLDGFAVDEESSAALTVLRWADAAPDADQVPFTEVDWTFDWLAHPDRAGIIAQARAAAAPWPAALSDIDSAVAILEAAWSP